MYTYNSTDQTIIAERVAQFRDQTQRFLNGDLSEREYLPLRLQNGVYVQRHAPMLRVAIPYGLLNSAQLRMLARIAREFDKGYGHISTRQNMQFNWPELADTPDILALLSEVEMHAIQTSGNCIRNTTTDQFAGVAADEVVDPRPYCELIRQWSSFHPEFNYLPRKFKIAVGADAEDRAAVRVHDIGLKVRKQDGQVVFDVLVGGGLGRTPMIGSLIRQGLPEQDLLAYLQAIVRVYNRYGRRDNKYKARIKILVKALTPAGFAERVEAEFAALDRHALALTAEQITTMREYFAPLAPAIDAQTVQARQRNLEQHQSQTQAFAQWLKQNTHAHNKSGYANVTLTLKTSHLPPGDVSDEQLDAIAELADRYSFGQARTTHNQNMVLTDVALDRLFDLWQALVPLHLATPNRGTINDIICCPGGDFCALANAKSIPVAQAIQNRFEDLDYLYDLGPLDLNISGCMNACGHHHVGHIGILGVDKKGAEFYQLSIGGSGRDDAAIGKILGPSISREAIVPAVEAVIEVYINQRQSDEPFLACVNRIGTQPFKDRVYAA